LHTHKKIFAAYLLLGVVYCISVPANVSFFNQLINIIIILVSFVVTIISARSPVLRENKWTQLYFLSYVLFIAAALLMAFIDNSTFFVPGVPVIVLMVLSQALLLSKNYTDAFRFVEETNENLEQIVNERTHRLQAANEAMQITNNAMKDLVTNISHDLKTPLHVMGINLETLSGLSVTENNADYKRHVRAAYQKNLDLQRLIGNLFEVSRIETDKNIYAPHWQSIFNLLSQAKEKYGAFLEERGIHFEIDVEDDIEIMTDPQKIWSVFDNIIYNAARYTDSGGIGINAQFTIHNSQCIVTITDTGSGVAPEHLPHVFERFYKVSQERSANDGESGLGLYIVKSIMEGCGGGAGIESEPGKGASVILTFPAKSNG
jgi:signal transduction histidine kinase